MRYLRENTATRVTVGPFLDVTDGITPEMGYLGKIVRHIPGHRDDPGRTGIDEPAQGWEQPCPLMAGLIQVL